MAAGIHHHVVSHSSNGTTTDSTTPPSTPSTPPSTVLITIEPPTEKTPLLGKKKVTASVSFASGYGSKKSGTRVTDLLDFKVIFITVLLVFGVGIATYLLIVDTRLPPVRFAVDYVSREAWSAFPSGYRLGGQALNPASIENVVIVQTGGDDCNYMEDCVDVLRAIETSNLNENREIPYNFMIGGDGQIYEGQGWTHPHRLPFIPQGNSIVIAFIGNFTEFEPAETQANAAKAFLQESVQRRRIQSNYHLYGMQNLTISHQDGSALYNRVAQWPHFDTILKFL